MIQAVCMQDCQIRIPGREKPKFYQRGQIDTFDLDEAPTHFMMMGVVDSPEDKDDEPVKKAKKPSIVAEKGAPFSFDEATEEMLLAADYDINDLVKYCKDRYQLNLPKSAHKTIIVAKFVDARYRASVTAEGLQAANQSLVEGQK